MSGFYFFTVILLLPSIISAQTIINNTLYEDQFACPDVEIVFTCEIRGFQLLAWESEELIGSGGEQIQHTTDDPENDRQTSSANPNAYAILTAKNDSAEALLLVSELHVTAPSSISSASVTCRNIGNSTSTEKSFTVLGQPNVPQDLFASQLECNIQSFLLNINITRCLNTYHWSYNPLNATQAGVNNYSTSLSGDDECKLNQLISSSGRRIPRLFCVQQDCGVRELSVSAVNFCGQESERSRNLVLNPEERTVLPVGVCVAFALSGAAFQNCALTTLLMALIIAMNFVRA